MNNETSFKIKVLKYLKKYYANIFVYKSHNLITSGIPDILICKPPHGNFCAIELKVRKNKPTKLQQYVLDSIKQAGGKAGVAYSIEDVERIINE